MYWELLFLLFSCTNLVYIQDLGNVKRKILWQKLLWYNSEKIFIYFHTSQIQCPSMTLQTTFRRCTMKP